jgi:hypothetical protein
MLERSWRDLTVPLLLLVASSEFGMASNSHQTLALRPDGTRSRPAYPFYKR